jgi:hypothetical protein
MGETRVKKAFCFGVMSTYSLEAMGSSAAMNSISPK